MEKCSSYRYSLLYFCNNNGHRLQKKTGTMAMAVNYAHKYILTIISMSNYNP
ncbi:hypothetical protein HanIR_Chr08g0344191 [Helianthus annuus]|nr:hypothetical protein HanIR_Chr08g0344191 [Helianthus annuus]